jgi:protease YdgD
MAFRFLLACWLSLTLAATEASAQDTRRPAPSASLPGIGSADPRQEVSVRQAPWRSVGRVQTELGGRCTGVLVAMNRVLTAAHCLLSPRNPGQFVQPSSVHFLLGYDRGESNGMSRVAAFTVGPGYQPGGQAVGADWALLALVNPIGSPERVLPLLREVPPPRTQVMLGGYQQDRPEVLMADTACRLLGQFRDPSGRSVLAHDCAGTRGASGSPLLARSPDGSRWGVIGVLSAVNPDFTLGYAVPAAAIALQ